MLCRCDSIGLVLLQELTFWGSASGAEARARFHAAPTIVHLGGDAAPRPGRGAAALGSDADTRVSTMAQDGFRRAVERAEPAGLLV
jgi:hypothetical protein